MKASWKQYEQVVGLTKVILEPGQFVFGRLSAAKECGISESMVFRCIKYLEKNETISVKSNNKFSVITVINWALYQSDDDDLNNKRTTSEQQANTNKNTKKGKNIKYTLLSELPSDAVDLAEYLRDRILEWKPNALIPKDLLKWAGVFRLMLQLDKRNPDEIAEVIKFATKDVFERPNVLSADKVRKHFDRIQGKIIANNEKKGYVK